MKRFLMILVFSVAALAIWSCGGDANTGTSATKQAKIEIRPTQSISDNYGAISINSSVRKIVEIHNPGDKDLKITEIKLIYTPVNTDKETSPESYAIQVAFDDGVGFPVAVTPSEAGGNDAIFVFGVDIFNLDDDKDRVAQIAIKSNAHNAGSNGYTYIDIEITSGRAKIKATPELVDFGKVGVNELATEDVLIRNQGTSDLVITGYAFSTTAPFSFEYGELKVQPDDNTANGVELETPIVVEPSQAIKFTFAFQPESEHPAGGSFVVYSNDPDAEDGTLIQLQANNNLPKIIVSPEELTFGPVLPGGQKSLPVEVINEGLIDIEIFNIEITDENVQGVYSVAHLDGSPVVASEEEPLMVKVGESLIFEVKYAPGDLSPLDPDTDQMIPDSAFLLIDNNSFYNNVQIPITGICTEIICPVAVIDVEEGEQVIPQTVLHMHGDQSYSANGAITTYIWEVEQPGGSVSTFVPSANFANPIFEANVAGDYIFKLDVIDASGVKSCAPATKKVVVIPDEAIHIELLWTTPNDPDETDEGPDAGTDMDLHFAHPWAAGPDLDSDGVPDPWFNIPYDVFWFNREPQWGSLDPSLDDNPGLDRDDTDGAGPENINLNIPEGISEIPFIYKVGVHYWDDKGFGPSFATVRVYIYAVMVFQVENVKMNVHDLWDVATVEWPSTEVKLKLDNSQNYKITPDYPEPIFQ